MDNTKWNYFQFRKSYGYPVFLRLKQDDLNAKFQHLFTEMGLEILTDQEARKIPLQKVHTRMLTVQMASARLNQQIMGSDLMDKYGPEGLSLQGSTPVYTYRKVGVMALPYSKTLWDLALNSEISHTDQMIGLRIILVRYLSQALSEMGVLSYWGTVKDGTVIVMKQLQSFGEAVFIDYEKKVIFSNGGEMKIPSHLRIMRKDKDTNQSGPMKREEVISFMSVSTCLLSFHGITNTMKRSIIELSSGVTATFALHEVQPNL